MNIYDVAAYILSKIGPVSAMKLQKLIYYCQAWSLVWDERPMFSERIEAWTNGPVSPDLYDAHKGQYTIATCPRGNADALDKDARDTVDVVLQTYGDWPAQKLSDLTHAESPWKEARAGLSDGERGNQEITVDSMRAYYSSL